MCAYWIFCKWIYRKINIAVCLSVWIPYSLANTSDQSCSLLPPVAALSCLFLIAMIAALSASVLWKVAAGAITQFSSINIHYCTALHEHVSLSNFFTPVPAGDTVSFTDLDHKLVFLSFKLRSLVLNKENQKKYYWFVTTMSNMCTGAFYVLQRLNNSCAIYAIYAVALHI